MVGLDPIDSGRLRWRGEGGEFSDIVPAALYSHSGFVTEDRRGEGLFLPLSASDNIVLPSIRRIAGFAGIVNRRKQKQVASDLIRR
jgi:ABC-type sugar transport system ATPase subunit